MDASGLIQLVMTLSELKKERDAQKRFILSLPPDTLPDIASKAHDNLRATDQRIRFIESKQCRELIAALENAHDALWMIHGNGFGTPQERLIAELEAEIARLTA